MENFDVIAITETYLDMPGKPSKKTFNPDE